MGGKTPAYFFLAPGREVITPPCRSRQFYKKKAAEVSRGLGNVSKDSSAVKSLSSRKEECLETEDEYMKNKLCGRHKELKRVVDFPERLSPSFHRLPKFVPRPLHVCSIRQIGHVPPPAVTS